MTLAEKLLPKLNEWTPTGAGRHIFSEAFPELGWNVALAADTADSLSCLVWELSLSRTADAPKGATLASWAAAVAARATGLMESLTVHEIDATHGIALLRSTAPARKGEARAYYELRLAGLDSAAVRRYRATAGSGGREQIAFALTHEAIAKLAGDIASN